MVVWGGDGGSSARAIEVRKVERKMERRVRRDRGGRGVGVSIADFFGEAAEEVNRVDAESSGIFIKCPARYGLSVIARLSKTTLPHLQTSGRFSKIPSAIRVEWGTPSVRTASPLIKPCWRFSRTRLSEYSSSVRLYSRRGGGHVHGIEAVLLPQSVPRVVFILRFAFAVFLPQPRPQSLAD